MANFIFNSKNYLPIRRAIGTICVPSYVNIFMNQFERKSRYSFIKTFSLIYHRFIDDIFFIGTGCKTDLENFLNELNINKNKIFRKKADC